MNKTKRNILIFTGVALLVVAGYFGFRYIRKKTREAKAKKSLEDLKNSKVPVFSEAKVVTKNVWKPKKPTISVMSSFSSASGSYFAENKSRYNSYSKDPILVGLEFYNMYKK